MDLLLNLNEKSREELKAIVKEALNEAIAIKLKDLDRSGSEEENEFYTRKEAANFLNCSLVTLYNYQKQGLLPYYQVGRKILFKKRELLEMMKVDLKVRRLKK